MITNKILDAIHEYAATGDNPEADAASMLQFWAVEAMKELPDMLETTVLYKVVHELEQRRDEREGVEA